MSLFKTKSRTERDQQKILAIYEKLKQLYPRGSLTMFVADSIELFRGIAGIDRILRQARSIDIQEKKKLREYILISSRAVNSMIVLKQHNRLGITFPISVNKLESVWEELWDGITSSNLFQKKRALENIHALRSTLSEQIIKLNKKFNY